jgi:hypothetical protein
MSERVPFQAELVETRYSLTYWLTYLLTYLLTYSLTYSSTQELSKECSELVVPPTSLKELVHRKKYELKSIFSNYPHIHRLISNVEQLLFEDMIKFDYFIPMILAANTLTR